MENIAMLEDGGDLAKTTTWLSSTSQTSNSTAPNLPEHHSRLVLGTVSGLVAGRKLKGHGGAAESSTVKPK